MNQLNSKIYSKSNKNYKTMKLNLCKNKLKDLISRGMHLIVKLRMLKNKGSKIK